VLKFNATVENMEKALSATKPDGGILQEGLSSIRQILEHAAGSMIAHPPEWLPALIHQASVAFRALQP
jgi:hypothetical protein